MRKGVRIGRIRKLWPVGDSELVYFQVVTNSKICTLERLPTYCEGKIVRSSRHKDTLV